jgi:hypothetical protein
VPPDLPTPQDRAIQFGRNQRTKSLSNRDRADSVRGSTQPTIRNGFRPFLSTFHPKLGSSASISLLLVILAGLVAIAFAAFAGMAFPSYHAECRRPILAHARSRSTLGQPLLNPCARPVMSWRYAENLFAENVVLRVSPARLQASL